MLQTLLFRRQSVAVFLPKPRESWLYSARNIRSGIKEYRFISTASRQGDFGFVSKNPSSWEKSSLCARLSKASSAAANLSQSFCETPDPTGTRGSGRVLRLNNAAILVSCSAARLLAAFDRDRVETNRTTIATEAMPPNCAERILSRIEGFPSYDEARIKSRD